jgi:hypothetical protein
MIIDEAIKRNITHTKALNGDGLHNTAATVQLGIEALKRLERLREWGSLGSAKLLPGETAEQT